MIHDATIVLSNFNHFAAGGRDIGFELLPLSINISPCAVIPRDAGYIGSLREDIIDVEVHYFTKFAEAILIKKKSGGQRRQILCADNNERRDYRRCEHLRFHILGGVQVSQKLDKSSRTTGK